MKVNPKTRQYQLPRWKQVQHPRPKVTKKIINPGIKQTVRFYDKKEEEVIKKQKEEKKTGFSPVFEDMYKEGLTAQRDIEKQKEVEQKAKEEIKVKETKMKELEEMKRKFNEKEKEREQLAKQKQKIYEEKIEALKLKREFDKDESPGKKEEREKIKDTEENEKLLRLEQEKIKELERQKQVLEQQARVRSYYPQMDSLHGSSPKIIIRGSPSNRDGNPYGLFTATCGEFEGELKINQIQDMFPGYEIVMMPKLQHNPMSIHEVEGIHTF